MRTGFIYNSKGTHVANVRGDAIFNSHNEKLYDLEGINIKDRSGKIVGRLESPAALPDSSMDKLFE